MGFQWLWNDVSAQTVTENKHYTDSIKTLIRDTEEDTAKAALLNQLSDYWSEKDSTQSVQYALRSMKFSKGYDYYSAAAHFYLGGAYFYNNVTKSKQEYLAAIDLLKGDFSSRALSMKARSWHNYGALLQREGNQKKFMQILLDHAIPLAHRAGDTLREAADYADVAMVFSNILNYEKAISYFQKAIDLVKLSRTGPIELASFYTRLAKNYWLNHQYDSVKFNLQEAREILSGFPVSYDHAQYYMVSGMYEIHLRQWDPAFAKLDTALSITRKLRLPYLANAIRFQQYNGYAGAERYPQAKKVLLTLLRDSLVVSTGDKLMILFDLAKTDEQMGNMRNAYNWLLQYTALADSLQTKEVKSDIASLEVKYRSEKKQRKILALQNENKQQELILQKKRFENYFLIAGILILLLISALIYMLYRNKRKSAWQQQLKHQQQLKQIAQDHQLKVYNAMLEGQEQERHRMARDLHDGLGGMLAGVKLKLSDIAGNQQNKRDMELYKVIGQLDHSVQELRRIARNMMPETLLRFGVETAINELCESLQTPSQEVEFQAIQLDKNLPQAVQIALYRIVQELLTNAVKHSRASNVLIQCSQNEDRIFITVEDDGIGFDVDSLKQKKGLGLANIRNRIHFLKGNLDIQSKPGEGTIFNVEINAHE